MKSYINKKERNYKQGGETKHMSRRFLSLILAFALIFSLPLNAFANGFERSGDVNLNTPTIHGDFDFDSSAKQKVIVEFVDEPVVVYQQNTTKAGYSTKAYETLILSAQQSFKRSIQDSGIDADILHSYHTVFNGMAVNIPGDEIDEMVKIPGVKAIYPVVTYHVSPVPTTATSPNMDNSAPFIGVTDELQTTLNGEGVKVGIIDTGVDYNHWDLADQFTIGNLGYDIVNDDNDPMETLPGDPNGEETYHGTHVAGTIAYIAPEASLFAYRVLGPGGWGSTDTIIAGIEQAVADEMDVINLSLGDPTNSSDDAAAIAINNAIDGGVVAVVANGNDGPEDWSVGSPATSLKAISVGASNPPIEVPVIDYVGGSILTGLMSFSPGIDELSGEYQLEYVGLGTAEEVSALDLTGKVALIERGTISFAEKSLNAQAQGAVAAVIFNNADGSFGGTLGELGNYIPTLSISGLDGEELLDQMDANPDFTISFLLSDGTDLVADFSSRGPVMDNLTMKPDVVAPGVDIVSTVPYYVVGNPEGVYTDAYASLQGTSMAAPHVAGVAALLLQKYPDWTPYDVKAALMNNAKQLVDINGDRYGLNEQGAGRIDVTETLNATVIAEVYEEAYILEELVNFYSGSINFGQVSVPDDLYRTVVVKDVYGEAQNFTIEVEWYTPVTGTDTTVTIDVYEADRVTADVYDEFKVEPDSSAQFDVGLSVGNDISDGYYEGAIRIYNSEQEILIPFNFYVGNIELPNPIALIFYEDPEFNWEITNQIPIEYNVYYRTRTEGIYTWLLDAQNNNSVLGIVNIEGPKEPEEYEYSFDSYIPVDGLDPVLLPDGDYVLYLESAVNEDHYNYSYLTLDREAPQINLNNGMEQQTSSSTLSQLSGQVNDLLIDIEYPDLASVSYAVYAGENLSVNWTELDFNPDGTFTISNIPLAMGENKVVFNTEDAAGNSDTQEATINRVASDSSSGTPSGGGGSDVPGQGEEEAEEVEVALKDKETTTLTLQNGLTLQIPSSAVGLENAQVQVIKASEEDTEKLLKTLSLGKDIKAFGQFYDFNILNENGEAVDHPTFNTSVTLSIPVDELDTGNLNKEKLSLFKILDDGTVKLIGGRVENGVLTVQLNSFSRYMVMAQDKKFTDVYERSYPWAVNEIEVLASKEIITGRTDTTFDPAANITRAEFTALLVRVLGLQVAEDTSNAFKDVTENAWYHDAVKAAVSNGLIQGYNESVFAPDKNITRAEMAVIIGRALNQLGITTETQEVLSMFEDKENIRNWAIDGVSTVVSTGIMQGRSSDRFVAEELTTRAEAAVVIYRLFNQQYLK